MYIEGSDDQKTCRFNPFQQPPLPSNDHLNQHTLGTEPVIHFATCVYLMLQPQPQLAPVHTEPRVSVDSDTFWLL